MTLTAPFIPAPELDPLAVNRQIIATLAADIQASAAQVNSAVELLDAKGREEELARMLGGAEVSKEARAAARKLLTEA